MRPVVHVVWASYRDDVPHRGYWDQEIVGDLLSDVMWTVPGGYEYVNVHWVDEVPAGTGAVVVLHARDHVEYVDRLNADLDKLPWAVVVLVGDEEQRFPVDAIRWQPGRMIYLASPHPHQHADRYIGVGWPTGTRSHIAANAAAAAARPNAWMFAGQVTHARRTLCVGALTGTFAIPGDLFTTDVFAGGLPHDEYYRRLVSAMVVPCPSGPETQDTFRAYEALEAGCVPLLDECTPTRGPHGFWDRVLGVGHPVPTITDWDSAPPIIDQIVDGWPTVNNRVQSWWLGHKRTMAWTMADDVYASGGPERSEVTADDRITVLVPTSPIPSHPSTAIIEETVASIRERLPDAEILVMCDGVRDEQAARAADYHEYVRRLLWLAGTEWHNVWPIVFDTHHHQARMTRATLDYVRTPNVLFVEHDTPLVGDVPFWDLTVVVNEGAVTVVRLSHETHILDVHRHMMCDDAPSIIGGHPLLRTAQWSQRPHLTTTAFYRRILRDHFSDTCSTMIEDVMHGAVWNAWVVYGEGGWQRYRVAVYHPDGDIRRSAHLDGRGTDPKFEMVFE